MTETVEADVDFQATATHQGRAFEEAVATMLRCSGWTVDELHAKEHDVEIDIVATSPAGQRWWIECKGSWRGSVPGARRGDTVKKAVGVAAHLYCLPERCPYMLVTSHLPVNDDSVPGQMLANAITQGWFAHVLEIRFPDTPEEAQ